MEFFSGNFSKSFYCAKTVILHLVFAGCVEPYVPTIIADDHNYLVAEGFFVPNDTTVIKLTRTRTIADVRSPNGESHAIVEIEGENGDLHNLSEKPDGVYVVPPVNVNRDVKYRIRIRTADAEEYLSDYVPAKLGHSFDSITWQQESTLDAIQFNIYSHDSENNSKYYLWTYDETWQYASGISIYYYENGQMLPRASASALAVCWKTNFNVNIYLHSTMLLADDRVHDFLLFNLPQSSRKMYFGYSILVKQYALTKEAFEYWSLTKKNSENLGTLFDPMPSQALSNIRCVSSPRRIAIGHFSVSSVQKKRVLIKRHEVTGPVSGPYGPTGYEDCLPEILPLATISAATLEGKLVQDRYYHPITQELVGYITWPAECLDCRMKGGVATQPGYWQ